MTKKQEENRQKAINYLNNHVKVTYKEERDWTLDHKWMEKYENVDIYYAKEAIDIALGLRTE